MEATSTLRIGFHSIINDPRRGARPGRAGPKDIGYTSAQLRIRQRLGDHADDSTDRK